DDVVRGMKGILDVEEDLMVILNDLQQELALAGDGIKRLSGQQPGLDLPLQEARRGCVNLMGLVEERHAPDQARGFVLAALAGSLKRGHLPDPIVHPGSRDRSVSL